MCECIYSEYYNILGQYMVKSCAHMLQLHICIYVIIYTGFTKTVLNGTVCISIGSTVVLLCYIVACKTFRISRAVL